MARVLFITAYKDIGRSNWKASMPRSNGWYLYWFHFLAKITAPLICFCEPEIEEKIKANGFTKCYPYEPEHTFFNRLPKQKEIIESKEYYDLIKHRDNPECHIPEYNIVNHNKVLFIQRAKKMFPDYTHYAWIDFGYLREQDNVPKELNFDPVSYDKIEYSAFEFPKDIKTPREHCATPNDPIQGSMFICPSDLVEWYVDTYTAMVEYYESINLVDDDQALVVHIHKAHPEKFKITITDRWFALLAQYDPTNKH